MKALSLIQPWAELVVSGQKTIELRTWQTSLRGEFLIHASKKKGFRAELLERVPVLTLSYGAILGSINLEGVKEYISEKEFDDDRAKHQVSGSLKQYLKRKIKKAHERSKVYGFLLKDPKRFEEPIRCPGALNFWEYKGNIKLEFPQVFGTNFDNGLQRFPSLDTTS